MDMKQLKALLKVLRENGVVQYKTTDLELQISAEFSIKPESQSQVVKQEPIQTDNPYANFPDGELTPEQLMYYSAGGLPENDPENKDN